MESKEELLERLGKKDGKDELRWIMAVDMAGELDRHVNFCFASVISLNNQGLIEFTDDAASLNDTYTQILESLFLSL